MNPTQFGPERGLHDATRETSTATWPSSRGEGVDVVYAPDPDEIYPPGYSTYVDVGGADRRRLEGAELDPATSAGSPQWLRKLFAAVQPGARVLRPEGRAAVRGDPEDGRRSEHPARGSGDADRPRAGRARAEQDRNVYLSPEERAAALSLSAGLLAAREAWMAGERDAERLRAIVRERVAAEPLMRLESCSVADATTLDELASVDAATLVSLAARVGRTRLIDNVVLG